MDRPTTNAPQPRLTRRALVAGASAGAGVLLLPAGPAVASPNETKDHGPEVVQGWIQALYLSQRDARALPPAAARLYALAMLAAYEAAVDGIPTRRSLGGQLNGLAASRLSKAKNLHWPIAINAAVADVAVAASFDRSQAIRDALTAHGTATHTALANGQRANLVSRSVQHGRAVAAWLNAWADTDGYRETRGLPYTPPAGPGLWRVTPPNFGAAIEPHWHRVRPFALRVTRGADGYAVDPAAPVPPIPYDATPGSAFYRQAEAVMAAKDALTDAQQETAMYWRDNPDGVTGLPAGHWLRIASAVATQQRMNLAATVEMVALMGMAVADAFTSCWIEKYRSNVLRPVTYIQDHIDGAWNSTVNSPAFPEYTSGHSTSSAAAAHVLKTMVGDRQFTDTLAEGMVIEGTYTLRARTFRSFTEAANEAAVSRLYGGIHYPMGIDRGLTQGYDVARLVLAQAKTKKGGDTR